MSIWRKKIAVELVEDRCRALEHRCEDLERAHKGLALEWEELYDKVRHQMSRMSRRVKTAEKEAGNGTDLEERGESPDGPDPISARILQRRNRGFPAS